MQEERSIDGMKEDKLGDLLTVVVPFGFWIFKTIGVINQCFKRQAVENMNVITLLTVLRLGKDFLFNLISVHKLSI